MNKTEESNIIIVSNRLPFIFKRGSDGNINVSKGSGGLVTAMAPILEQRGGTWIGWPGYVQESDTDENLLAKIQGVTSGYSVKPVMITSDELKNYYEGFSNSIIWPLFHDSTDKCLFLPEYWKSYKVVNEKFASTICQHAADTDFIWIHDYHLLLVGTYLRKKQIDNHIGFFLHIPFPPIDTFERCPWRFELLVAMLDYNILGFQTIQDKRNFIGCLKKTVQNVGIDVKVELDETLSELTFGDRRIRIGVFPISIDYNDFFDRSKGEKVGQRTEKIRNNILNNRVILGVDRLDYTKGIPAKLQTFRLFLNLFPEFQKKVRLIQVVVPSRREISAYADLKLKIEQLVGEINGKFGTSDWLPVQYMFRTLTRNELISLYRISEVALITPLKDGMNLIAKEYCASNVDENGVLILSEFAGAAQQFYQDAILVNPYDFEGTTTAISKAFNMSLQERKKRMRNLRQNVQSQDVFWWLSSFLNATKQLKISAFPKVDEYIPSNFPSEFMTDY
ncbi:MAG: trehalose 6-phosphate synthase/phosphatase [Desulforhopalus sp.]|jgi:trehalose 6-phosphate synthase/phosphatase